MSLNIVAAKLSLNLNQRGHASTASDISHFRSSPPCVQNRALVRVLDDFSHRVSASRHSSMTSMSPAALDLVMTALT
jgi:hypothetical protein